MVELKKPVSMFYISAHLYSEESNSETHIEVHNNKKCTINVDINTDFKDIKSSEPKESIGHFCGRFVRAIGNFIK